MIGVAVVARRVRTTSFPSASGSPRSRRIASGFRPAACASHSRAVAASTTWYSCARSVARRKRRMWGSSSMTSTTAAGVAIGLLLLERIAGQLLDRRPVEGQREAHRGAAAGARLEPDPAAVGGHDAAADGEPEARSRSGAGRRRPRRAIEPPEDRFFLARGNAGPPVRPLHHPPPPPPRLSAPPPPPPPQQISAFQAACTWPRSPAG